MAVVSFADIRARFCTKIETLTGFTESRNPFDDFNRNPNTVAQKRFSVGIGEVEAIEEQRQSTSTGIICNTTVLVKFPFRLRPKDQIQDYDNSMTTAQDIISAITTRAAPLHTNLQIFFDSMENDVTDAGEYIITTLTFNVLHQITA